MKAQEFARRRKQLMRMVGDGGITILPVAVLDVATSPGDWGRRQDGDSAIAHHAHELLATARKFLSFHSDRCLG